MEGCRGWRRWLWPCGQRQALHKMGTQLTVALLSLIAWDVIAHPLLLRVTVTRPVADLVTCGGFLRWKRFGSAASWTRGSAG